MKKYLLILFAVFALNNQLKAQQVSVDGFEAILLAAEDAEKLTEAYLNPAMKGLVFGMNSGWYHTAKVHKKFGFDISINLNASIVPDSDEIFQFAQLGLRNTTSNSPIGATVAGPNNLTPIATYNGVIQGQNVTASFELPGGVKDDLPLNAIPTPSVQLTMGLPWKMDGMLRLIPKVGSDDVKGRLLGLGLKKEITDIFGPMEKTPLHVSILAAMTTMNVDYDIQNDSSIPGSGQKAEFKLNSYTFEAIASLNFPVINLYGGIGYNGGKADLDMLGTYNLDYTVAQQGITQTVTETVTNPIAMDFNANGFKTTLGARISLGFFKLFGSYTIQNYNTLNAGISFGFR